MMLVDRSISVLLTCSYCDCQQLCQKCLLKVCWFFLLCQEYFYEGFPCVGDFQICHCQQLCQKFLLKVCWFPFMPGIFLWRFSLWRGFSDFHQFVSAGLLPEVWWFLIQKLHICWPIHVRSVNSEDRYLSLRLSAKHTLLQEFKEG